MLFLMEVPAGSVNKYEFRTATGQMLLDRKLCKREILRSKKTVEAFPASYGITPGRFNMDGDPLDLLVLGSENFYQSYEGNKNVPPRQVKVIGLVKMEECGEAPCKEWEQDWKILAVDKQDPRYQKIHHLKQLDSKLIKKIKVFMANYKGWHEFDGTKFPKSRVTEILGRKAAMRFIKQFPLTDKKIRDEEIKTCRKRYREVLALLPNLKSEDTPDDKLFLNCIKRVHANEFLADKTIFDSFLRYSAYQILKFDLNKEAPNLGTALNKMEELRNQNKKHYRFVGYDSPKPGTGNPIFEWVKTVNRNENCLDPVPQHYEHNPLIDTQF